MKLNKMFFAALLGSVLFVSCSDDDSDDASVNLPLGAYENGFFILNEGNASAGTVSFVSDDYSIVKQDVFGAENDGEGLGGYLQSIFFNSDRAYIISSASNKITVVNRYTFKLIDVIESEGDFVNPRYAVVYNGKAYVTNFNTFASLTDDFITVINLATNEVEDTIEVGAIAEKIFVENNKLYVLNGSYGDGSSITVINPANGEVDDTIDLPQSPNSFEVEDGKLYVLTGSSFSAPAPSHLVRINLSSHTVENDITFPAAMIGAQNLCIEDDKIYFNIGGSVYDEAIATASVSETALFTSTAMFAYGFHVEDGRIYVTDSKDYVSDGQVFVYSLTGTQLQAPASGLIPNGVYFN